MSLLWTSVEAAAATGGRSRVPWRAEGVSIDSRSVAARDLFVALSGPNHDGHDHVREALAKGATAAMVSQTDMLDPEAPFLQVEDTLEGLRSLGIASRVRNQAKVLALTGSVGKTGTKEALRHVLGEQALTHANVASYNNHWGVPLTLARMPLETAYAVFEVGMNHAGEIGPLSRMIRPHVALITTVEIAHLEFFASIEGIARAKAEIFEGLEEDGTAILNADNPMFDLLSQAAEDAGASWIIGFGGSEDAEARLIDADCGADGSDVRVSISGREIGYRLNVPGFHWVQNSVGVLAGCLALGADLERAAASLAGFSLPAGRGVRREIDWPGGTITLIDESYNANPASVRAAIDVLGQRPQRRVLVLGDMLELGPTSLDLHAGLAPDIDHAGIAALYTAGPMMQALHDAASTVAHRVHAEDSLALAKILVDELQAGDAVLIKGSLGSRMKLVLDAILKHGTPEVTADAL